VSDTGKGLNPWFNFNEFCIEQTQLASQDRFPATYLKSSRKSVTEHIEAISHISVKE